MKSTSFIIENEKFEYDALYKTLTLFYPDGVKKEFYNVREIFLADDILKIYQYYESEDENGNVK